MTNNTCNSLKANSFKGSDFLDPKSTLNTRHDFRVDPKKVRTAKVQKFTEGDKPKKKNLTFNQLLVLYKYI